MTLNYIALVCGLFCGSWTTAASAVHVFNGRAGLALMSAAFGLINFGFVALNLWVVTQ